jgi:hypothetical protein
VIVIGEGVPFVVSVIDPLTVAAEVGVKIALKFRLAPAAMVVEVESPVWVSPVPVTVICEKVSVVVPLFFSVMGWELLLPTAMFPKATLAGVAEICA